MDQNQNKKKKLFPLKKSAALILLYPCQQSNDYKTLLLKRKSTMSFSNSYVFPGGACDPEDESIIQSNQFPVYSKMTAIRQCLQQSGLLVFPAQLVSYILIQHFLTKNIKQMCLDLAKIWINHLGLIQPILRLMTPQVQKGKRYDCIFHLVKINKQVRIINIGLIKKTCMIDSQFIKSLSQQNLIKYQKISSGSLIYNNNQSDGFIFDTISMIFQQFKQKKLLLIPPQIVIFTGLLKLCYKQRHILQQLSQSKDKNLFESLQHIMFQFNLKNRKLQIFGDSNYDYKHLIETEPDSNSKKQLSQHFEKKIKQNYIDPKGSRFIKIAEQFYYVSSYKQKQNSSFLKFVGADEQNNKIVTRSKL